ncbi:hypothetical protein AGMMS50229_16570 [Campylobacterota bacterium]|nr:hypothetical protein AGMMS50229_16570 [Campylobacterota bacterium]
MTEGAFGMTEGAFGVAEHSFDEEVFSSQMVGKNTPAKLPILAAGEDLLFDRSKRVQICDRGFNKLNHF